MTRRRLGPLVWPVALLLVGALVGQLAETAVDRWQDYQLYGLSRPVVDILLVFGVFWLVVALFRLMRGRRRRDQTFRSFSMKVWT